MKETRDMPKTRMIERIRERPGQSREELGAYFGIPVPRLGRLLRQAARDVLAPGSALHIGEHGIWVIDLDRTRCAGVDWVEESGAYVQCPASPCYSDGRCYAHSSEPNAEFIAFEREMGYLLGPGRPNVIDTAQLGRSRIEELEERLSSIPTHTHKDVEAKARWERVIRGALGFIAWKKKGSSRQAERISPEFLRRHRESSVNPFEFTLRKCFAVLETTPEAARDEVLNAWRRLAKRHHPDRTGGDDALMKALNEAKDRIFRLRGWD
jgi:hypothetical protein